MGRVRARIARRHDEVKAHGRVGVHEVGDAEVALGRVSRDDRIAVQAQARHRRREDARPLVVALVEHLAGRLRDEGVGSVGQVPCRDHAPERLRLGGAGVREDRGDAGERLVGLRVEHVQDRAAEQAVRGRLPVVAGVLVAGGVDEDVGDVLRIAHLAEPLSDLEERVEAHRVDGRGLEPPRAAELPSPSGGEGPVLLLDVVDEHRVRPGEQRRDDQADALAAAGGRETEDVLGPVVAHQGPEPRRARAGPAGAVHARAKPGVVRLAEHDARVAQEARPAQLRGRGPARAAVGDARGGRPPPEGGECRRRGSGQRREGGDRARVAEERRSTRWVPSAPESPPPGGVDAFVTDRRPGRSELGRAVKARSDVLGRGPRAAQGQDQQHHQAERTHPSSSRAADPSGVASSRASAGLGRRARGLRLGSHAPSRPLNRTVDAFCDALISLHAERTCSNCPQRQSNRAARALGETRTLPPVVRSARRRTRGGAHFGASGRGPPSVASYLGPRIIFLGHVGVSVRNCGCPRRRSPWCTVSIGSPREKPRNRSRRLADACGRGPEPPADRACEAPRAPERWRPARNGGRAALRMGSAHP